MSRVKIVNCGVPPRGCHVEYGVMVDGSIVAKSQVFPDGNLKQIAEREALAVGIEHYTDQHGSRVDFTPATKVGEIRGPFRTSKGNPMPFMCYVRGDNGWIYFHGTTSGDALQQAKNFRSETGVLA